MIFFIAISCRIAEISEENIFSIPSYSSVPNKRTGGNFDKKKQISVHGGILIKILKCRVKTGNFIHNKRDS